MSSYNAVNATSPAPAGGTSSKGDANNPAGAPTSADPYLIDTLLRQTFGFQGYVTSDCDAVFEEVRSHRWTIPSWPSSPFARPVNNTERNALAQSAGEDSNCNAGFHDNYDFLEPVPGGRALADQDAAGHLQRERPRRRRHAAVHGADEARRVRRSVAGAVGRQGARRRAAGHAGSTPTPTARSRRRRRGWRWPARRRTRRSCCSRTRRASCRCSVPATGAPKIAVMGMLACPAATVSGAATTCPGAANVFLGGYSATETAAGQKNIVTGYDGIKKAVQAINPNATVDLWRGFTGTGSTASTLTNVDPAAVAAAGGYDAVIVYVGTDGSTAAEDTDRAAITLPGAQSIADQPGRGGQSEHDRLRRDDRAGRRLELRGQRERAPLELLQRRAQGRGAGRRAARRRTTRAAGCPRRGRATSPSCRASPTTAIRPTDTSPGRTYMYFTGTPRYPFGYGLSYSAFDYSNLQRGRRHAGPRRVGEGVRRRQEHERRRRHRRRRALRDHPGRSGLAAATGQAARGLHEGRARRRARRRPSRWTSRSRTLRSSTPARALGARPGPLRPPDRAARAPTSRCRPTSPSTAR